MFDPTGLARGRAGSTVLTRTTPIPASRIGILRRPTPVTGLAAPWRSLVSRVFPAPSRDQVLA
jgi:hypothetical protein